MTRTLEALEPPTRIIALFRDDLYGVFAVEGPLTISEATGKFMVGGWFLDTGLKPNQHLLALGFADPAAEEPEAPTLDPRRAPHGTLVTATFEQHPYGQFIVAGHVVATEDKRMCLVGRWILHRGGHINPRLKRLTRLDPQDTPEPARITGWRNDIPTS